MISTRLYCKAILAQLFSKSKGEIRDVLYGVFFCKMHWDQVVYWFYVRRKNSVWLWFTEVNRKFSFDTDEILCGFFFTQFSCLISVVFLNPVKHFLIETKKKKRDVDPIQIRTTALQVIDSKIDEKYTFKKVPKSTNSIWSKEVDFIAIFGNLLLNPFSSI